MSIKTVNIIGAGNVATQLALALERAKKGTVQAILSKRMPNAQLLADRIDAKAITDFNALPSADLILIAVKDDAIAEVVMQLHPTSAVVHTSGSKSVDLLSKFSNYGILYPLQTFSKGRLIEMANVPFFLDVPNNQIFSDQLAAFCKNYLSNLIYYADSDKRATIHLAAVIASNFSNHLLAEAEQILKADDMPLHILAPLLKETLAKAFELGPVSAQTGPAKREDEIVLNRQLAALADEDVKRIYQLISKRIQKMDAET